jgi:hypothetical protein
MTPSIEKQHQRQKESEMSRNTNDCWSFCGRLVCSEGGRASGRSVSQSERQGTSYSFSRLLKAVDYIYVCVCVCVLTRWPFGRVRLVLSSHVAQIMCVGRHHCAHHGTSNQFHVQCQPVLFFYKPKRPATTLFFISLCSRQNKTRKWLCVCV